MTNVTCPPSQACQAPEDEAVLCQRAGDGDGDARHALYAAHAAGVMTIAMRLLCERSSAEDVVQDTFIKAFAKLPAFAGRSRFSTWLRRIAINECLQRLRSPWHTRAAEYEESDAPAGSTDDQIDLLRALATLDPVSRAVVWLHDVEGFKHAEIAAAMERTPSFSKSRLARAHRALRSALSPDGDEPERNANGEPATEPNIERAPCTSALKTC